MPEHCRSCGKDENEVKLKTQMDDFGGFLCVECIVRDLRKKPAIGSYVYNFDEINERLDSIDTIIKDSQVGFHMSFHDAINTRIQNIFNVLGMDLNGTESKTLNELKELHIHQAENDQIIHEEIYKIYNNLEEVLREFISWFKEYEMVEQDDLNKILEKLDSGGVKDCKDCSEEECDTCHGHSKYEPREDEPKIHKIHELKTIPKYFQPLLERIKTFEIRINDRDFKVGDTLSLREYSYEYNKNGEKVGYTGREMNVKVLYILKAEGSFFSFLGKYVIMGIKF